MVSYTFSIYVYRKCLEEAIILTAFIHVAEGLSIELLSIAIVDISICLYTINKKKRKTKEKMILDDEADL